MLRVAPSLTQTTFHSFRLNPFKLFPSSPSPHFLVGTIATVTIESISEEVEEYLTPKETRRGVAWKLAVLHFGFVMSRLLGLLRVTASNLYTHFMYIHMFIFVVLVFEGVQHEDA